MGGTLPSRDRPTPLAPPAAVVYPVGFAFERVAPPLKHLVGAARPLDALVGEVLPVGRKVRVAVAGHEFFGQPHGLLLRRLLAPAVKASAKVAPWGPDDFKLRRRVDRPRDDDDAVRGAVEREQRQEDADGESRDRDRET
ncbi:MAG: hypothetical protein LC795_20690 [Acidobacteria bacterium]|nr:hypothetical protein [Acidobacteriota bacterium]